ncbi:aldehyde dehydrogenase family protein [Nocardia vinacea]|uniref:aldehyde dehydrogenase family protein n=1 Tax=Nocardia vinacea TaxID=96468 RepID=UPI001C3F3191
MGDRAEWRLFRTVRRGSDLDHSRRFLGDESEERCLINRADRLADNNEYGLAASVWTKDIDVALRLARGVQAGGVSVNAYGRRHHRALRRLEAVRDSAARRSPRPPSTSGHARRLSGSVFNDPRALQSPAKGFRAELGDSWGGQLSDMTQG